MRLLLLLSAVVLLALQDDEALFRKANQLLDQGKLDEAINEYTTLLNRNPGAVSAYVNRAAARLRKGDLDGSIEDSTRAIELSPRNTTAYLNRAEARRIKGDGDAALQDFGELIRLDPKNVAAFTDRALIWLHRYEYAKSIEDSKQAIKLDPRNATAYLNLGAAYTGQKETSAAIASLARAIEIDPKEWRPYLARARIRTEIGDYDAALADCDKASKLEPKEPELFYHRGACHLAKAQWKEAEAAWQQVLQLAPEQWKWRHRVDVLLEVLPEVRTAPSGTPPIKLLFQKGMSFSAAGDTDRAIGLLEEVVRLDSKSADAHEALATAYARKNRLAESQDEAFEVVALRKTTTPALRRLLTGRMGVVLYSLRWLACHQMADGRWSSDAFGETCRKDCPPACGTKGSPGLDVRATGLVLLALHGAGYAHLSKDNYDGKPMGAVVKDGLAWLIGRQSPEGCIGPRASTQIEDHGIAALALSEAYGITAAAMLKDPVQKAIDFLVSTRLPGKGWPARAGGPAPDPFATGWSLLALRSAQLYGLKVPAGPMDEGYTWLWNAASMDKAAPRDRSTAFALAVGAYLKKKVPAATLEAQLKAISTSPPEKAADGHDALHCFLSAVALRVGENGPLWTAWKKEAKTALIAANRFEDQGAGCPTGSWDAVGPVDGPQGRVITTALNALTFEIYYGYQQAFCTQLPEAQKK